MRFEILMDKRENPDKCTIHPVKNRNDFSVRYFKSNDPIAAFESEILLHVGGECLSEWKKNNSTAKSLAVIDCNWKKVPATLTRVAAPLPKFVKIPEGFVTAYPRRNKQGLDPDGGLATIEALFIAAAFLGAWDETLLEKYYFREAFLKLNEPKWNEYRLGRK